MSDLAPTDPEADGPQRARAATRVLHGAGLRDVRVEAAGMGGEVAAVRAAPSMFPRLTELAAAIRACGFGYVALDLQSLPAAVTGERTRGTSREME